MSLIFRPILFAIPLCLSAAVRAGPPAYVESGAGLETPAMEGGDTEIEFGDVDGDGHVDLVSIGDHGSPFINSPQHGVMVWRGDGHGSFSVIQTGDFGYGGIALGDVNGDGLMDVGYGMHHNYSGVDLGNQLIEVALGDGSAGSWTPWDDGLATSGETWGMFGTDFADVDHDGDLDLLVISFGAGSGVHVYRNHGDGTWSEAFGFLGGNSSNNQVYFADFNGDGHPDFAVAHGSGTVYFGDGTGDFTLVDGGLPDGPYRTGVGVGDVNDDGRADLSFCTDTGIEVWTWADDAWASLSGTLANGTWYLRSQIADMNNDGHGDVVAFVHEHVDIHYGDGRGGWTPGPTIVTPETCDVEFLRTGGDVDHNGFTDVLIISEEQCAPFVGGANRPRLYVESSVPRNALITPVHPRGGERVIAGSVVFVDWRAATPSEFIGRTSMTIDLSLNGPGGPWQTVVTGAPDNGRFQWTTPASLPSTAEARLRFTLAGPTNVTAVSGPFIIEGRPASPADLDGDGSVGAADLAILLAQWGPCPGCAADFDEDDVVGQTDLAFLLAAWSP